MAEELEDEIRNAIDACRKQESELPEWNEPYVWSKGDARGGYRMSCGTWLSDLNHEQYLFAMSHRHDMEWEWRDNTNKNQ